jgi:hypothetical protein
MRKSQNLLKSLLSRRRRKRNLNPQVAKFSRRTVRVFSPRKLSLDTSRSNVRKKSYTMPRKRIEKERSFLSQELRSRKEILNLRRASTGSNFRVTRRRAKTV